MSMLCTNFSRIVLLSTGAALAVPVDTVAKDLPVRNIPVKDTIVHATPHTFDKLGAVMKDMVTLAGKHTNHLILLSPKDIITDEEHLKAAKAIAENKPSATVFNKSDAEKRMLSLFRQVDHGYPKGFLSYLDKSGRGGLRIFFKNLAEGAPHATAQRDPEGNVCVITGMVDTLSSEQLLKMISYLAEIEVSDLGSASLYTEAMMRHEAVHCNHDTKIMNGKKWHDAELRLRYELEADSVALSSMRGKEDRKDKDAEIEKVISFYNHARAVGTIRMIVHAGLKREEPSHSVELKTKEGRKIGQKDMILSAMLLNAMSSSINGMVMAKPHIILGGHPHIERFLSLIPNRAKLTPPQIIKYTLENYTRLGDVVTALSPPIEYAGFKYIEGKLQEKFGTRALAPYEEAMMQMTRNYLAGMEALQPSVKSHPFVAAHIGALNDMPPEMWEEAVSLLDTPQVKNVATTRKVPESLLGMVQTINHGASAVKSPVITRLPLRQP